MLQFISTKDLQLYHQTVCFKCDLMLAYLIFPHFRSALKSIVSS